MRHFRWFLNTVALIRLLRNKWNCLVNPEFRIPRFFLGFTQLSVMRERDRIGSPTEIISLVREQKSFWGDDLAPWRHQSPPPKKEKAETTQTIIMNWSLERSVHILHLHLFSLSPLDVLSFIDVLQVFLLLEFSLGVNPQKKVVEEKVKQDPTKHLRSNTSLYGYWFWVFYIKRKKEEMKSRLTRCQWSLSGLLKLWLMEYRVGCVKILKSFAEKLFLKTDQGKHQWKVGILRLEVA